MHNDTFVILCIWVMEIGTWWLEGIYYCSLLRLTMSVSLIKPVYKFLENLLTGYVIKPIFITTKRPGWKCAPSHNHIRSQLSVHWNSNSDIRSLPTLSSHIFLIDISHKSTYGRLSKAYKYFKKLCNCWFEKGSILVTWCLIIIRLIQHPFLLICWA